MLSPILFAIYVNDIVCKLNNDNSKTRIVPIFVNVEVDWGNAYHKKTHIIKHNGQNEINCTMMKAYWQSVPPDGIPRYLGSIRYIIPSLLIPRYFSDTGIPRIHTTNQPTWKEGKLFVLVPLPRELITQLVGRIVAQELVYVCIFGRIG